MKIQSQAIRPVVSLSGWHGRLLTSIAMLVVAAGALYFVYSLDFGGLFNVKAPQQICSALRGDVTPCRSVQTWASRALLMAIGLAIISRLSFGQSFFASISKAAQAHRPSRLFIACAILGTCLVAAPYTALLLTGTIAAAQGWGLAAWGLGFALLALGTLGWTISPLRAVQALNWQTICTLFVLTLFPELSWSFGDILWNNQYLQAATFVVVEFMLSTTDYELVFDIPAKEITIGTLRVFVDHSCSGIAGILFCLTTLGGYIALMHKTLHLRRALVMLPIITVVSWLVNALRITLLLVVAEEISPDLAVDGFHSYAGWIAFMLITAGFIVATERITWFQKGSGGVAASRDVPSLLRDDTAAQILPFAVFLATSLLTGALFLVPAEGYPLRFLIAAAFCSLFWRCLPAGRRWGLSPISLASGAIIAALWLMFQPEGNSPLAEHVPGLAGVALIVWVFIRILSTTVLVPIVEELFFRGYLLKRMTFHIPYGRVLAVLGSSAVFAVLHGNWALGFAASLILAGLALWRGRLMDAIYAHAAANFIIAFYALIQNDWSVI